jgi:poly(3-hydroxybutyrate) depolymerase
MILMVKWSALILVVIALAVSSDCADASPVPGAHELAFSDWAGPQINVRVQVPQDFDAYTPIVLVMHGASRDMPRYFDDWSAQANTHGFIAVVPEFTTTDFKGSARYNLGHVFDRDTGERRDEITWTFSAIEPLFDQVVEWAGSKQQSYALFGHSAGSQFVHRFLYYKPDARVSKAILANAGWYTMPDFGVDYPYGLSNSGVGADVLAGYFGRDVTVLLGDADTDTSDEDLRRTPEAELQGPQRLARGQTFFRVARAKAEALGVDFNWQIRIVPGAEHSNAQMTPAAAELAIAAD